jgi:hypothetical protein
MQTAGVFIKHRKQRSISLNQNDLEVQDKEGKVSFWCVKALNMVRNKLLCDEACDRGLFTIRTSLGRPNNVQVYD